MERLIYILGAGHCGSTLLNLMLDAHPDVFGLGEIHRLNFGASGHGITLADLPETSVWFKISEVLKKNAGLDLKSLDFSSPSRSAKQILLGNVKSASQWIKNMDAVHTAIRSVTSCQVMVDSSKEWQRLAFLDQSQNIDIKVLHLVRDGRGVVNAYRRKYGSSAKGYRRLMKLEVAASLLRAKRFGADRWMQLRYEDLVQNPESMLQEISRFCGIDFNKKMLNPSSTSYDGIGGNRMRYSNITEIKLDERWRDELTFPKKLLLDIGCFPYHIKSGHSILSWL